MRRPLAALARALSVLDPATLQVVAPCAAIVPGVTHRIDLS